MPIADLPPFPPEPVEACIVEASIDYGVSANLLRAIAFVESSYRQHAVSPVGAVGVMQINLSAWHPVITQWGLTPQTLKQDACVNVAMGAWILRRFYDRYQNWTDTLAAYNAGHDPRRMARARIRYSQKVLDLYADFEGYYTEQGLAWR